MICEICGKPIKNKLYIELCDLDERRGTHKACMRERITKAFAGCVGTEDDDVGALVMEAIEAAFEEVTPQVKAKSN